MSLDVLALVESLQHFDTKAQELISKMTPALLAQVVRLARERESAEVLSVLRQVSTGGSACTALEMLGHLINHTHEIERQRDAHEDTIASLTLRLEQVGAALEGWGLSGNEVEKASRFRHEVSAMLAWLGKDAIQVREGAGRENLLASLAVSVNALRQERDTLRERVNTLEGESWGAAAGISEISASLEEASDVVESLHMRLQQAEAERNARPTLEQVRDAIVQEASHWMGSEIGRITSRMAGEVVDRLRAAVLPHEA